MNQDPRVTGEMTFLEHLVELRSMLLHCAIACVTGALAGWWLAPRVLEDLIQRTVKQAVILSPIEAFNERIKLSLLIGLMLVLPYVFYRIWKFIVPGLFRRERSLILPMALGSMLLFALGVAGAYFYLVPLVVEVLGRFQTPSMIAQIRLGALLGFFYNLALSCGLVFQIPLVAMVLTRIGLVTPGLLLRQWRLAIVFVFLTTAIITPGDVVTAQLVMGIPMTLLYFVSVGLSWLVARRQAAPKTFEGGEHAEEREVRRGAVKSASSVAVASKPPKRPAAARSRTVIAVDVGNSETVIGWFHGKELAGFRRLTSGRLTGDEVELVLDVLLRRATRDGAAVVNGSGPLGAVLCSVAPSLTLAWAAALERLTGVPPVEVNSTTAKSLPIRYHDRTAVGADRIANAIAARAFYGTPAIVVDLGTATTFDCISKQGAYLGGAIVPGVAISAEELFRRAARLPRVELRRPARALGRTTEESLQAGVLWGAAGQVDALVRRLALEMKGTPNVVATGGLAGVIAPECETINRVDESLTLKGMRLIWEENR